MQKGTTTQQNQNEKLITIGGADQKVTLIFLAVAVPLLLFGGNAGIRCDRC